MSTGSYKSASSVSESSASSGSQPPSSSEEVHTCHRCGDCCFSDQSAVEVTLDAATQWYDGACDPASPDADIAAVMAAAVGTYSLPHQTVNLPGSIVWRNQFAHDFNTLEPGEAAKNAPDTGYRPEGLGGDPADYKACAHVIASYSCSQNRWSYAVTLMTFWTPDAGETWEEVSLDRQVAGRFDNAECEEMTVTYHSACCGASGNAISTDPVFWNAYADWAIEVSNNPCCRDPVFDECFQHFHGDCRGDCDETPGSSSGSSSSSEGNPLP